MNYGEVLSKAWQIIWKHKILWIFGILAGCAGGGGSGSGGGNPSSSVQNSARNGELPTQIQRTFEQIPPAVIVAIVIGVIVFILVLVALSIFLGTIGKIGLVRGTQQADQDMDVHLTLGGVFRDSMPYFWRVFLLNLLVGVSIFVVIMLLIILGIGLAFVTLGLGICCILPLICLMIPVMFVVTVIVEQASIAIVVENLGVMDGLRKGWQVVKDNPAPMVVMFLILNIAIAMIVGLIIAIPMLLVLAPLFTGMIAGGDQALAGGAVISLLCCAAYLPVLLVLSGIMRSYVESAWTLTYLRLYPAAPVAASLESLPEQAG